LKEELSQLIALQETDLEIRRLHEEIAALPVRQQQLEDQFAEANKEFLALQASLNAALEQRRGFESDLEAEQQKHEKFKTDLMKATNEREYSTAIREIDATKKTIGTYETEVLKLMETIEKLDAQVKERAPQIEASRQELDQQIAILQSAATEDQAKLTAAQGERQAHFDALGPTAKSTYNRLSKMRNGVVLAEARNYSCQACRVTIRPQVFADIRRAETIIECENCGRILYFRAEAAIS
jgi:uncharacterized protein